MKYTNFDIEKVSVENKVVGFCNDKTIVKDESGRWFYTFSSVGGVRIGEQVFQDDLIPIEFLPKQEQFIILETLKDGCGGE